MHTDSCGNPPRWPSRPCLLIPADCTACFFTDLFHCPSFSGCEPFSAAMSPWGPELPKLVSWDSRWLGNLMHLLTLAAYSSHFRVSISGILDSWSTVHKVHAFCFIEADMRFAKYVKVYANKYLWSVRGYTNKHLLSAVPCPIQCKIQIQIKKSILYLPVSCLDRTAHRRSFMLNLWYPRT